MKKINIIILLLILKTNSQNYNCIKEILKTSFSILKVFSDYSRIGLFFEKEQLLTNYNNFKNLIKNCEGKIPNFLDIDECVKSFVFITNEINSVLIDVDQKKYDIAVLNIILLYGKLIELNNLCLNSKLFKNFDLKMDFQNLLVF